MDKKEVLQKARELITPREKWTTGSAARDAQGCYTGVFNEDAVCFCAYGAVARVLGTPNIPLDLYEMLDELAVMSSGDVEMNYVIYNDTHSHAEVLEFFDRAIERAE